MTDSPTRRWFSGFTAQDRATLSGTSVLVARISNRQEQILSALTDLQIDQLRKALEDAEQICRDRSKHWFGEIEEDVVPVDVANSRRYGHRDEADYIALRIRELRRALNLQPQAPAATAETGGPA